MELNKSSSDTNDSDAINLLEDSPSVKKIKLEKEIEDLQNIAKQLRKKLATVTKDLIKNDDTINEDAQTNIKLDLYKYGGLYCLDVEKNITVMALNSFFKNQQENQFAVQFVKEGKNMKIGKWVLPMSIDMNQLESEVSLKDMQSVQNFTKNCKRHTDCYTSRLYQFQELKSYIDNLRNCNVQSNVGYTSIILELFHVRDKENDSYATITIYLWYDSNKTRPTKIEVEMVGSNEYNKVTEKELKNALKVLRLNDLRTAFVDILNENNTQFTWKRIKKDDSTVKITELSSSEEDEIVLYKKTLQKRRPSKRRKGRLKRKDKKKKKADSSGDKLNQKDANVEEMNTPLSSGTSMKGQSNIIENKLLHQSTLRKFTLRSNLKKERQDFKITQNKLHNIKQLSITLTKLDKKYTSTPKRSHPQSSTPFKVLPIYDISDITVDSNIS